MCEGRRWWATGRRLRRGSAACRGGVAAAVVAAACLAAPVAGAAPPTLDQARELHRAGALEAARDAYLGLLAAGPTDSETAATVHNNLCVLLGDLGEYRQALGHCRRALALRRRGDDRRRLARALNNLGLTLYRLGRLAPAAAAFEEALAIDRRLDEVASEALVRSNLGLVAGAAGRYGEALEHHQASAALALAHPDAPWAAEQLRVARINQGVALEKLGAFREALDVYRQVLDDRDSRRLLGDRRWAHLELNLGVLYRNLGDPQRAVAELAAAAELFAGVGDRAGLASAVLNLGQVRHLNLDDPGGAEAAYRRALALAQASGDRTEEVQALFLLGRLLIDEGALDEATAVLERCLTLATEDGAAEALWSAHLGLGLVARRRGRPAEALEHFEAAIARLEAARSDVDEPALRGSFFAPYRPVYAAAVEVLGELGDPTDRAFELVQLAKERELTEALEGAPRRAAPFDRAALARRLGRRQLLEFFVAGDRLVGWLVRPAGGRLVLQRADLGEAADVLGRVVRLHRELAAGRPPADDDLAALGAALLGPFAAQLRAERLLIAPDGRLRYLPFELLPFADGAAPAAPLVERHVVAYLPSASTLLRTPGDGAADDGGFFGLADPRLPPPAALPTPAGLWAGRFHLEPLPSSVGELEAAARAVGGAAELRFGVDATEAALLGRSGHPARVVHLAAHALVDERPGGGAAVLLAPGGGADGVLRPAEIARLDLPSRLTVLAACSSALGERDDLGALGSLTGAFLAAGSRAVVSTLWQVGDQPASVVMAQLYHELGRGRDPARALAVVKRRLRADRRWSSPALWAGWVVTGDAEPVVERRRWGALLLAALLAALGIGGVAGVLRRRRRGG